jgi:membrane protease subunit (stomatin/prohibitin family)
MPLFEGHKDKGLQRLFIEIPDHAKDHVVWKWPDQQIIRHSQLNVDLDYEAVFTNLGKVIGVLGPGRHPLDEGASLTLGWLVDRLTGNAYYNAEVYFVATRDIPNIEFGGPVDNLTDAPTGLVVTVRVFGELAFRVTDPAALLARLIGTGSDGDAGAAISTWVKEQTLAAVRAVLPDIVSEHGVLAMGQIQAATSSAALSRVNEQLLPYGLAVTAFAELNTNLPAADAQQLKRFAATKAYSTVAGSFNAAVRGQAALQIAEGVAAGNVGAEPGIVAGMLMGVPVAPPLASSGEHAPGAGTSVAGAVGALAPPSAAASRPDPAAAAHFCAQCGAAVAPGGHFCSNCGAALPAPAQ